jgi:hypothetical protein
MAVSSRIEQGSTGYADMPTCRHADMPTRRHADTPIRRYADTPIPSPIRKCNDDAFSRVLVKRGIWPIRRERIGADGQSSQFEIIWASV